MTHLTNQLFGDSAVRWTNFSDARNIAMNRASADRNQSVAGQWVSSNGATTGDLNWY